MEPIPPATPEGLVRNLRVHYRRPALRTVDTQGRGVGCGKGELDDWAGGARPIRNALIVGLVHGAAWIADSEGTCIEHAYGGG